MTTQIITSAATSLNQIAAGFKMIRDMLSCATVVDFGGGKYDKAVEYCKECYNTRLYVLDPFNRTPEHNEIVMEKFYQRDMMGYCVVDYVTCFNVLNVLSNDKLVDEVCCNLFSYAANTWEKIVFVTVYEGDKSGIGKETTKGYQRNAKLASYVPFLKKYFSVVKKKNNLLICEL